MRAAARLHRDDTGRETFGENQQPLTLYTPTQHHTARAVQANQTADILTKVDPKNGNALHRSAPLLVIRQFHNAEGGAGHSIRIPRFIHFFKNTLS
jgi:hypothetical protein